MSEVITFPFEISGSEGEVIRGDVRVLEGAKPSPVIVVCHGFKGFKDWGFFPWLCSELAGRGFYTVIFNFSHNGIGEDLLNFTELDKFKRNTFSFELFDLEKVLAALEERKLPNAERAELSSITLLGHSRGGFSAIVGGEKHREITAVVSISSICKFFNVSPEEEAIWRREGVTYVENTRTKQQLPLGLGILDEIKQRPNWIEDAAKSLKKPTLIIHGEKDPTVPLEAAKQLHSWISGSELLILPEARSRIWSEASIWGRDQGAGRSRFSNSKRSRE